MKFENEWHRAAQELTDENTQLRRRLAAFEQQRSPDEFPIDFEDWQYDGERFIVAPHHSPAYSGEKVVICELNGPAEAREHHAYLICHARSALFWWRIEQEASHHMRQQVEESEARRARLKAEIQDLQLILARFPPDLVGALEELLENIGFHFSPNRNTVNCVNKTQEIIDQIKATRLKEK